MGGYLRGRVRLGTEASPELLEAEIEQGGTSRGTRAACAGEPRRAGAVGTEVLGRLCDEVETGGEPDLAEVGGEHALAVLSGPFLWLATDRLGTRPLYYAFLNGGGIAFDSDASRLAGAPGVDGGLEPQALYDYFHFHMIPGPETLYRGVHRLPPGTCLRAGNGEERLTRYWQPQYRPRRADPGGMQERFRDAVFAAVERSCAEGSVGAFLSGGTDSSTIVGAMSLLCGGRTPAYSIGFDVPGYDETDYAREVARYFGIPHRVHYLSPSEVGEAVPQVAAWLDQPFGNASIVPAHQCARLAAEDGVQRLLGGDGGDELFGGNTRYAKQQVFESFSGLPAPVKGSIEPVTARLPAIGPLRKVRSYVAQARVPLPDRLESYNLLENLGPGQVLAGGMLEAVDIGHPRKLMRNAYAEAAARDYVNRLLALDLRFTLADNDLIKVRQASGMAGLSATFPFLDDEVVALSLELPVGWKVRRNALRPFFKEALRDFLPRTVLNKSKQGFGLPFGVWLAETDSLNRLAREALDGLVQRRILREGFAQQLLKRELPRHPGYYGTFVWVLMMLGQWLDAHDVPRQPVL